MSLKSINDILGVLEIQDKLIEQPFIRLLNFWSEVVGTVIAAHTQPLSIQRDVLQVATSSAAWAQNLTFERQKLLLKINQRLPDPLADIRFSTKGWQRTKNIVPITQTLLPRDHPSYLGDASSRNMLPHSTNANAAFINWAKAIQDKTHNLPLCPQCQSPTPPGEIQRWGVCSVCAAKQF